MKVQIIFYSTSKHNFFYKVTSNFFSQQVDALQMKLNNIYILFSYIEVN